MATVLYNLLESIRFSAVLLQSFMPETSAKIFEQINTSRTDFESLKEFDGVKPGDKVGEGVPLFQRIDEKKMLDKIAEDSAKAQPAAPAQKEQKKEKKKEQEPETSEITIDDFAKVEMKVERSRNARGIPKRTDSWYPKLIWERKSDRSYPELQPLINPMNW